MVCNTCGEQKPKKDSCAFTKATVQINNPKELALFRKVVVPASLGDDTEYPPKVGKYCNVILYYEANDQVYLYSSDGIPTRITVDITELKRQIKEVKDGLTQEISDREDADQEIWTEIETIEAASDVVDVVGTYAELQQYDTSKLHANDLIKVLQDETRDDAITYYRWNGSAFTYVGAEGPYYTASETDTLLAAKQDALIAGANIQIAADGKTISATDTTYTHFTGATASTDGTQGLVPGPLAGDENKVLKGDGTWQNGYDRVALYIDHIPADLTTPFYIYKDSSRQQPITWSEMRDLLKVSSGKEVVLWLNNSGDDIYHVIEYCDDTTEFYIVDPNAAAYYYIQANSDDPTQTQFSIESIDLQRKLTAGSNISISNQNVISATDTTYTAGTGISISAQNVISATGGNSDVTYVYYDASDIELSNYVSFHSDAQLSENFVIDDVYAAYQDGPVILVGIGNSGPVAYGNLVDISEHSGDYALTFYVWQYEQNEFKSYRIDGLSYTNDYRAEFTKTDMTGSDNGLKVFYYDYDAALAASDGDAVPLYTGYEPSRGLDVNTEIDDDGDLFNALDGVTSALLIGIYENGPYDYYIKCADIVISSAGSENQSSNIVDPYLSIIKDELQTKQIWKFAINPGTDNVSIYKSNLQPGVMVGATSLAAGTAGLVPAPTTSDVNKVLAGDGTWVSLPSANNISSNDWSGLWQ